MDSTFQPYNHSHPTVELNSIFRKRLQPMYLHRWACDWAFDNISDSAFHQDNLQPPQLFSQLVLISVNTDDPKEHGSLSLSLLMEDPCACQIAFVPCHKSEQITLGYVICFASIEVKKQEELWPFAPPFLARFILDHEHQSLTMIIPSFNQNIIAIHSADLSTNSQYSFIIRMNEYDWNTLPNHPLAVLQSDTSPLGCHEIETINSRNAESDRNQLMKNICVSGDEITGLLRNVNLSSKKDTSFSNNIQSQTTTHNQFINSSSSRSFDESNRISYADDPQLYEPFRNAIKDIFCKTRFSIGRKIDSNPTHIPGYSHISRAPHSHYIIRMKSDTDGKTVAPSCAKIYYGGTLHLDIDSPLFVGSSMFYSQIQTIRYPSRSVTQEPLILPRPETTQILNTKSNGRGKKHDRQTIIAERKKRNRLSAAKSNAKKQEQLEMKEKELQKNKRHVKTLEELKNRRMQENERLRHQLGMTRNS